MLNLNWKLQYELTNFKKVDFLSLERTVGVSTLSARSWFLSTIPH